MVKAFFLGFSDSAAEEMEVEEGMEVGDGDGDLKGLDGKNGKFGVCCCC